MQTAQANARMALVMAIGQLQVDLGPDKRVNASGGQYSGPSPSVVSAAVDGRKHWIGAYNAHDFRQNHLHPGGEKQFRRWLVSGNENSVTVRDSVASTKGANDVLLFQGSAAGFPVLAEKSVYAPKVTVKMSDRTVGAYAWWIGDENSKALIKPNPKLPESLANVWGRAQAGKRTAFETSVALAALDPSNQKLALLASPATLDLASERSGTASETFHDFTTQSFGVLCDVQQGGLKNDLSLKLDVPESARPQNEPLYTAGTSTKPGITMEELWLFHNVWTQLDYDKTYTRPPPIGGKTVSGAPVLVCPVGAAETINDVFLPYKALTYPRKQLMVSLKTQPNALTTGKFDVLLISDMFLTVWNPYDIPIALDPNSITTSSFSSIPYSFEIWGGNSRYKSVDLVSLKGQHQPLMDYELGTKNNASRPSDDQGDPVTLMPGEVMLYSEGRDVALLKNGQGAGGIDNTRTVAAGKAGWNFGAGYQWNLSPSYGNKSGGVNSNMGFGTLNAADMLAYKVTPSNRLVGWSQNRYLDWQDYQDTVRLGGHWLQPPSVASGYKPKDFPEIFSGILTKKNALNAGQLANQKFPLVLFSYQLKTEASASAPGRSGHGNRFSMSHNPKVVRADFKKLSPQELAYSPYEFKLTELSGSYANAPQVTLENRTYIGGGENPAQGGQSFVITHSIPREPPLSLGAFQHAIANGFSEKITDSNGTAGKAFDTSKHLAPEVNQAIGNSYASPLIGKREISGSIDFGNGLPSGGSQPAADHSWQVNTALWDSWFLSSIVQQTASHHSPKRTAKQVLTDFVANGTDHKPLPNPSHRFWGSNPEKIVADFFTGNTAKADAFRKAASIMMLEGSFNVNSTSVEAWTALLSSNRLATVPVIDITNGSMPTLRHSSKTPISGLLTTTGDEFQDGTQSQNSKHWVGQRALSDTEIRKTAEALVEQVRLRGPFLSLSDFINRRPSDTTEIATSGALQAALDDPQRGPNRDLDKDSIRASPANSVFPFPEASKGFKSTASQSHVTQADLLTTFGSSLSARSDTFRVRAYGEALDSSGNVAAKTWCEAIVQRTPNYVDPSLSADKLPGAGSVNERFGRRFEITSFRWLSHSEMTA
ncbi:MAG: hypothetical protein H7Y36_00340 [Armatimonadetes bacterium]|nr:hypothetical protein [Akkermansiaceae bacterium]